MANNNTVQNTISSIVTRAEYKTYLRIRAKLAKQTQYTQTDDAHPLVILVHNDGDDEDEDDEDEDDEDDEDEDEEDEEDEDEEDDASNGKNKKKREHKDYYFKEDNRYFKKQCKEKQVAILRIENEIEELNKATQKPLRFKILESNMDIKLKSLAISKLDQLNLLEASSGEYYKMFTYIENMCKLPIGKIKELSVGDAGIAAFLEGTKKKLNDQVYGHDDAKEHIIRLLAKWISNPDSGGLVIGIQGDPGCGKTKLCKDGICEALGLPFGFIGLGGASDGSFLVGHSFTYESSRWGMIADILMKTECSNPIIYFDELDKISMTQHGDEIMNILIHLTDSVQNSKFHDKYFADLDLDLSKCLIIFSYNNEDLINPILKDRMVTVRTSGYTLKDKIPIAQSYMLPELYKSFSFKDTDLIFTKDILTYIISLCPEEQGVRNLKRALEDVTSHINLCRLLDKPILKDNDKATFPDFPLEITKEMVDKFVNKKGKDDKGLPFMYM